MDRQLYCAAQLRVDGPVHLGRVFDGLCYAMCASAHRQILLPVSYRDIDCAYCLKIMVKNKIEVNATYEMVKRIV